MSGFMVNLLCNTKYLSKIFVSSQFTLISVFLLLPTDRRFFALFLFPFFHVEGLKAGECLLCCGSV